MTTLHDDIELFEKTVSPLRFTQNSYAHMKTPLYTIDKGGDLIGKEFTIKGKQMMVVNADDHKKTMALAPIVQGKPDPSHGLMVVTRHDFDKIIKHHFAVEASERKKKRHQRHSYLLFAPFFGRGDGKSPAEIHTGGQGSGKSTGGGPAYPGEGGINAPGVGSGPNSGMGPSLGSSTDFSGRSIMEDVKSISEIFG